MRSGGCNGYEKKKDTLPQSDFETRTGLFPEEYEIVDSAAEADGILVRSASMHEMEFSENLRAVARAGAGVNNIPLDACAERGIVVFNTPGANANGVKRNL